MTSQKPKESAVSKKAPKSKSSPNTGQPKFVDVQSNKSQYIISPKKSHRDTGLKALAGGAKSLIRDLKNYSGIDVDIIERRLVTAKTSFLSTAADGDDPATLLVSIDQKKGDALCDQSNAVDSPVWIEPNGKLSLGLDRPHFTHEISSDINVYSGERHSAVSITVTDTQDKKISEAIIYLYFYGELRPSFSVTDKNGSARIRFPAGRLDSIVAMVVEPISGFWSKVIRDPELSATSNNRVIVQSFLEFDPSFGANGRMSWGIERYGLIDEKSHWRDGEGVKIGVIDTGCDNNHPLLGHMTEGVDFNRTPNDSGWNTDEVGHGTHCAGIIGARSNAMYSFRGVAPYAEVISYKVFPNGDFFKLGGAIEAAINDGVDIINMSLGSSEFSNDISENIQIARERGILCVAAAGNSANSVQFPARLSSVLGISAVGDRDVFPDDSTHSNALIKNSILKDGSFPASFSCFGPEIDFAAPGVAVISTVPRGGFKAMDGTSMAAPHISGLAALLLAANTTLKHMKKDGLRVDELFSAILAQTQQMPFGRERIGHGFPVAN